MTDTIEEDNQQKMDKYKCSPPHPSYISGLIDGDGCVFIRKISDGYQSGITITQCRTNVLQIIRYHFGGSITSCINRNNKIDNLMDEANEYFHKHNVRNQYNLLIRSNEYQVLLEYLQNSFIIKQKQYMALYEFNKLTNLHDKIKEKEILFSTCLGCNLKCEINAFNLSRINIEYISGLFDAEGCFYINKNNNACYISISQKNHPLILYEIQKYLCFGKIERDIEFKITKKLDCLKFIHLVKPHLIVKYNQAEAFETFLQTNDTIIKEKMYKICNEEKHKIENFIDLNQNDMGKEGYVETIRLRELKEKVCKQILIKQVYKEKSEKMKGEGNHNYGKEFSKETKKKMSNSIKDAKNSVSDETIIKVGQMIKEGHKNIDIQHTMNLPRHTITRIKNGTICCRIEEKINTKSMTKEEVNLSKRKIQSDEIIDVIEKYISNWKPKQILDYLIEEREKNNIPNTITIDIVKNIKRNMKNNQKIIYESEVSLEKYNYYTELINKYNETS